VEIIEEYEDKLVRSVTFSIRMPSVVRFFRALRGGKRVVKFSRENVFARDKGRCQYCGARVPRHEATYDHVRPRAQGGITVWENVVIACVPCNQRKGGRTPEAASMRLLAIPHKPRHLPEGLRVTFTFDKSVPRSWLNYLRDVRYWHDELDSP
jgi:5-methylcytosine-specific restriction endonuclease McrA